MMRKLLIMISLLLLTACATSPLQDFHVVERYGSPDEIIMVGPVVQDRRTGIFHDSIMVYDLPLSKNPEYPDQRVVYLMEGSVVGIVVFGADGSVTMEDVPAESMSLYYRKMFNDWLWI